MDKVISLDEVYCNKVMSDVLDMAMELEDDGIVFDITREELHGILHQFYHLYQSKGIIYSYQEDMQGYFATIFTYVSEENIPSVSFMTIIDGFFKCYEMMSPVEIGRSDFTKTVGKVKNMVNWKGERHHAR